MARVNGSLDMTAPLATVLIVTGALLSAGIWAGLGVRSALRTREEQGVAAGAQREREAHRRFVARLDHELKNPVTAIRAALELDPDPSPSLGVAAAQAGRLANLIGELRSLSALETSAIERVPVDLAAVVRDETAAFSEDLEVRSARRDIRVQLPAAPWPLPSVAGDADLLAVVVRNLLVNAAKYSDPDARIEIRGSEDSGFVVVEVADTGWGIPEVEQAHVWDELWRGDRARRVEGSGLGLSLVRIVAERHGGDVAVRSREGSGTSVRVRIPTA
ncbi:hypothetical protein BMH32_12745 [Leucobacter sp. OLJS4]|nr:hypothetical protein BMH25_01805 [Leucobacter sp. OLCALW19]PII92007.1 hypothetical protein BMH27_06090 [Leucobacter sp. OLAS13]PII94735.1 hypothetical protein BMH26_02470 [Leucobacter sp. OLTLW20]PII96608.1 hypothetical protein BMH29_15235 [Leucobacter sp. OLDS2]PII99987.1 hypothetical protein BMH28_09975 [Leucobacter sp. OLCS4]PIJ04909.1 hypothetical protein BMH31_02780 [Leucobacter sp. OLIS6]PIJ07076.1 hypothetical protein BMH32_12745 [Leucobacter sp. OLJS4]PIJ47420.1 hypothetical prote